MMAGSKFILLADDQPEEIKELFEELRSLGYEVRHVADGNELVNAARERKPDMIISDLMMPYKDGFEAIEEIRTDPGLAAVPVIVNSLFEQKDYEDRLGKLGVRDYFIKSDFSRDALVRRVGEILA